MDDDSTKDTTMNAWGANERRRAIDNAIATTRMDGLEPTPEVLALYERVVVGEISLDEAAVALRKIYGV